MSKPMTTAVTTGRRRLALLTMVVIGLAGAAWTEQANATSDAAPAAPAMSLEQALAVPAGNAAGDGVLRAAPNRPAGGGPQDARAGDAAQRVNNGSAGIAVALPQQVAKPYTPPADELAAGATAGCSPGYGRGSACLPLVSEAAAEMNMTMAEMPWTCSEVRKILPQGIAVDPAAKGAAPSSVDPLHLDKNQDGVACGTQD